MPEFEQERKRLTIGAHKIPPNLQSLWIHECVALILRIHIKEQNFPEMSFSC